MTIKFRRDQTTWVSYAMLAWFAYLQATPGLVIPYLREELHLTYSEAGLHIAAFAGGSMIAGLGAARLDQYFRRETVLWIAATVAGAGAVGLAAGSGPVMTAGSVLLSGLGGGLILVTVQAALADHHGDSRAIALAEANVAASAAYLVLIGALSLTAALQIGWRSALLFALVVPIGVWWRNRGLVFDAQRLSSSTRGRLPWVIWIASAVLFCTTAAEWCVSAWGATFVVDATGISTEGAIATMAGYFSGVLGGRILGSWLARRHRPAMLLVFAIAVAMAGFLALWVATEMPSVLIGLLLLGIGLGNLFPMGVALTLSLVPGHASIASGRIVATASSATLLAPLALGALADAVSLHSAFLVTPVFLVLSIAGLAVLSRSLSRGANGG